MVEILVVRTGDHGNKGLDSPGNLLEMLTIVITGLLNKFISDR